MEAIRRLVSLFLLAICSGALGVTWWMTKSMQIRPGTTATPDQQKLALTADFMQTYLIPVFGALTLVALFYAFVTFVKQRAEE